MSYSLPLNRDAVPGDLSARLWFVLAALGLATAAAALAGWTPLYFSVATVFLFAGPHNWLEFRYFLTRLPARWGRLRGFFLLAFAGMIGLMGSFVTLFYLASIGLLADAEWG